MAARTRVAAVAAVAVAIGFFAWLILKDGDEDRSKASKGIEPVEVSAAELVEQAGAIGTPVYWAGELAGRKLELTQTAEGRVFVRYLPLDVPVGERRTEYLTVGTYPAGNAYGALRVVAKDKGSDPTRIDGGGLLVGAKQSRSAHFSYPAARYQVEVFSPAPGRARQLVIDGKVQPVR